MMKDNTMNNINNRKTIIQTNVIMENNNRIPQNGNTEKWQYVDQGQYVDVNIILTAQQHKFLYDENQRLNIKINQLSQLISNTTDSLKNCKNETELHINNIDRLITKKELLERDLNSLKKENGELKKQSTEKNKIIMSKL